MSRSGYDTDGDGDNWSFICWRGAVTSAIRGKRGQAILREIVAALDAMPEKRLIAQELEKDGAYCTLGAVGKARGISMDEIDPDDYPQVSEAFGISDALSREIMFENDEGRYHETPEARWQRMRSWAQSHIASHSNEQAPSTLVIDSNNETAK